MKKIDDCKNNPKNSSITKVSKHIQFFQCLQNLYLEASKMSLVFRGKYCMRKFCEFLREKAMKII